MALSPARPSAPPRNPSTCAPLTWSRRPTRATLPMICTIPTGVVTSMIMMSPSTGPISIVMTARSHIYAIRVVNAMGTRDDATPAGVVERTRRIVAVAGE